MGYAITYCSKCGSRISSMDTGKTKLVSHGNQFHCAGCAPAEAQAETPIPVAFQPPVKPAQPATRRLSISSFTLRRLRLAARRIG